MQIVANHWPKARLVPLKYGGQMYLKGIGKCLKKPKQEFRDDGFFITGDIGTMDERQLPYPLWAAQRTSLYRVVTMFIQKK